MRGITRRRFLHACGGYALLGLYPFNYTCAKPQMRPNIILIVADDLGYGDLGCYGQKKIQTPNIDRLASEGMRFTQFYAGSSVCAPSRCSLMTGMHNGHNRIRDNLPNNIWLRPDDITLAEVLKQAGYKTGGIGKWALGNPGTWGMPNCQGFDYWYGHLDQNHAHFYYPDYLWENDEIRNLEEVVIVDEVGKLVGNRGGKNRYYTHDLFTEKTLKFIELSREKPFFLYLAYTIPHYSDYPAGTPEHFIVPSDQPYTNEDWPQIAKNYAAMITRMDRDVGKIMDFIRKCKLESSTAIFLTSDNGPYEGAPIDFFGSSGKLRGCKRDLYEGGIRVPFIARWPGLIEPNKESEHVLAFWDVLPTVAEMAGLEPPANIDGLSFLPALKGQKQKEHEYLFWDYGHSRKTYVAALRAGEWKGVKIGASPMELYNLEKDPTEAVNLAQDHPEIVHRIKSLMKKARSQTDDYPMREL